jgi:hypothetical protein
MRGRPIAPVRRALQITFAGTHGTIAACGRLQGRGNYELNIGAATGSGHYEPFGERDHMRRDAPG